MRTLGSVAVGETVKMKLGGASWDFLVLHHGNPDRNIYSTTYDDGTILLLNDAYEGQKWNSSRTRSYSACALNSYLNEDFFALFDDGVGVLIKTVKVPYRAGDNLSRTVTSGEDGLPCKIFLLSANEIGLEPNYAPENEGSKLDYFDAGSGTGAKNKRIAKLNGSATYWWLRSPYCDLGSVSDVYRVLRDGSLGSQDATSSNGVRPALVLPNAVEVDDNGNIVGNRTIGKPGATLIGATAYGITAGKVLVNGTAYDVTEGKAMIAGTAYDIAIKQDTAVQITLSGSGSHGKCSATINGVEIYSSGSAEAEPGDTIRFTFFGTQRGVSVNFGQLSIDGTRVRRTTSTEIYTWTIPDGVTTIEIRFSMSGSSYGDISVTTS